MLRWPLSLAWGWVFVELHLAHMFDGLRQCLINKAYASALQDGACSQTTSRQLGYLFCSSLSITYFTATPGSFWVLGGHLTQSTEKLK